MWSFTSCTTQCRNTRIKARLIITIDGPVAAGKTSAAAVLATRLAIPLLDTGAIYRCVAWEARRRQVDWQDESGVSRIARGIEIVFQELCGRSQILLGNAEVTEQIRRPKISQGASIVSSLPRVRTALLELQRCQATANGLIAEGRDTGTVVFPQADHKFFLTASPQVRARRRYLELESKGISTTLEAVSTELQERDHRDTHRTVAPLLAAADAVTIDGSELSVDQVVAEMVRFVRSPRQHRQS